MFSVSGMAFDAASFEALSYSFEDDSDAIRLDEDEIRRIFGPDVRRRVSAMKLGARVVGMATAEAGADGVSEAQLVSTVHRFAVRTESLLRMSMSVLGLDPEDSDYGYARLALSRIVIDMATEEWRHQRLCPDALPLQDVVVKKMLSAVSSVMPERYEPAENDMNLALARQLAVIEVCSRVAGLHNYFHFFREDVDSFAEELMLAVVDQAEVFFNALARVDETVFGQRALIQRSYTVSSDLMVEAFKRCAAITVAELRSLPEHERAFQVPHVRATGGLSLEPVVSRHRQAVAWALRLSRQVLAVHAKRDGEAAGGWSI